MKIQNEESVILFLVVWTMTEITRYSYYTFNLLRHLPYFIKWARWRCRDEAAMSLNSRYRVRHCRLSMSLIWLFSPPACFL